MIVLSNGNIVYSGNSGVHLIDFNKHRVQVDSQPSAFWDGPRYLAAGPDSSFYMTSMDRDSAFLTHYDHDFNGLWTKGTITLSSRRIITPIFYIRTVRERLTGKKNIRLTFVPDWNGLIPRSTFLQAPAIRIHF